MKRIVNFIFIVLIGAMLLGGCDGQSNIDNPNATHFVKFYGRDGDQTGVDMVTLPDGSVVLFGNTTPSEQGSTSQWYLVKTDAKGTVIWEKEFGSPNGNETASDIELTADSRLVTVGNAYAPGSSNGDVLIKTFTLEGVEIASNQIVRVSTDEDAKTVTVTSDGFIVAGSTNSVDLKAGGSISALDLRDALHLRFDNNLVEFGPQWKKTTGFDGTDVSVRVVEVSVGKFYVFGHSNRPVARVPPSPRNDYNFWYFELDNFGTYQKEIAFGPTDDEKLGSVSVAPSGYVLCGITYNQAGNADVFVQRLISTLNGNGNDQVFAKPLSLNIGLNVSEATASFPSIFGGVFLLANEKNSNENQNWLLTKINTDGSIAWKSPIIFGGEGLDTIGSIKELSDGRVLIIGTMKTGKPDTGETKMTLIKVDGEGKLND